MQRFALTVFKTVGDAAIYEMHTQPNPMRTLHRPQYPHWEFIANHPDQGKGNLVAYRAYRADHRDQRNLGEHRRDHL